MVLAPSQRPRLACCSAGRRGVSLCDMMTTLKPSFATGPYRPGTLLRNFVLSPLDPASWRAAGAILMGLFIGTFSFALLAALFSTGGSFLIVLVGFAVVGIGVEIARIVARVERWRMTLVDPRPLRAHTYRTYGHGLRAAAEAEFMDENRWRDVIYVLVSFPLTILEFVVCVAVWATSFALLVSTLAYFVIAVAAGDRMPASLSNGAPILLVAVAFVLGLFLLAVAASMSRGLMRLHRAVVEGLLCTNERAELRLRVETLRESRSAMLQVEASELRRIERDLHDGAQQRLVMLAIDLSLASDRIESDPAGAKALMNDAREQARQALAELRDLVRGSAPAILLDRGLVAALGSVAGRCPVPTIVESALAPGERQPHAVERAAYFVVCGGAHQRCQTRLGDALRDPLPPRGRPAHRRSLGRRRRRCCGRSRRRTGRAAGSRRGARRCPADRQPRRRPDASARRNAGCSGVARSVTAAPPGPRPSSAAPQHAALTGAAVGA
jgi:signal transduction histidine kinase